MTTPSMVMSLQVPIIPFIALIPREGQDYPFANFTELIPCVILSYCLFYVVYSMIEKRVADYWDGLSLIVTAEMVLCIIVKHSMIGFENLLETVSNEQFLGFGVMIDLAVICYFIYIVPQPLRRGGVKNHLDNDKFTPERRQSAAIFYTIESIFLGVQTYFYCSGMTYLSDYI